MKLMGRKKKDKKAEKADYSILCAQGILEVKARTKYD